MKKYYIAWNDDDFGDGEDGWIYTKTPHGKYRILALLYSEVEDSFWDRKHLLKEHGVNLEDYDYDFRPPRSHEITEAKAKKQIIRWKKTAKEIWPDVLKKKKT